MSLSIKNDEAERLAREVAKISGTSITVGVITAQEKKGNPEAAKVKNPVASTPESIAAGEAIYMRRCRGCHAKDRLASAWVACPAGSWSRTA